MGTERYALQDRMGEGAHWSLWRGTDTMLRRPVSVLVVTPEHPTIGAVAQAAIGAGSLGHPGSLHVYDVSDTSDGGLRVVGEWVPGARSFADVLADGPLPTPEACRFGVVVGDILLTSHLHGIAHRQLRPEDVLVTVEGRLKLLGLGVSSALAGDPAPLGDGGVSADALRDDTRGVADLTFAAVTGFWPGPLPSVVPPPPLAKPYVAPRARQVRAGVPADLDELLAEPGPSLGMLVERLDELATDRGAPHSEESAPAVLPLGRPSPLVAIDGGGASHDAAGGQASGWMRRFGAVAVVVGLLAGAGMGAVRLMAPGEPATEADPASASPTGSGSSPGSSAATPSPSESRPSGPLVIVAAKDFDPTGDGTEKPEGVPDAIDGDLTTAWETLRYNQVDMAPKTGVGLLLDLGGVHRIGAVRVDLVGRGTSLTVLTSLNEGATPETYQPLGSVDDADELVTVKARRAVQARWVLVWLTRLPDTGAGYRGGVAEVTVLRS